MEVYVYCSGARERSVSFEDDAKTVPFLRGAAVQKCAPPPLPRTNTDRIDLELDACGMLTWSEIVRGMA